MCPESQAPLEGSHIEGPRPRVPFFLRQVPSSLPYLHHPFFHLFTCIVSVIEIFTVFYSDLNGDAKWTY